MRIWLCSLLAAALAASLTSCSSPQQQSALPSLEVALAVAETAANSYKALTVADPAVVAKMKAADSVAYDAVKAAERSAATGSSVDLTAATGAVAALQALVIQYVPRGN